jgi:hypothetical protein
MISEAQERGKVVLEEQQKKVQKGIKEARKAAEDAIEEVKPS